MQLANSTENIEHPEKPKRLTRLKKLKLKIETMKHELNIPKTRSKSPIKQVSSLQNHNINAKKRPMSAQRVTLFKHSDVVVNAISEPHSRCSSGDTMVSSHTGSSLQQSIGVDDSTTLRSTSNRHYEHSLHGHAKQTLVTHEPFELYEIKTMDENQISIGCYLSLGKNDKMIRPILPKLRIQEFEKGVFHIFFSSPSSKYWEMAISDEDDTSLELLRNCLKNICNFESAWNKNSQEITDIDDDEDVDELEEFLESSSEEEYDTDYDEIDSRVYNVEVIKTQRTSTSKDKTDSLFNDFQLDTVQQQHVNDLFKKTMNKFRAQNFEKPLSARESVFLEHPSLDTKLGKLSNRQKRYSSFEVMQDQRVPLFSENSMRSQKIYNRRSISVPMEFR